MITNGQTFYPSYSLAELRMLRGRRWSDLVDRLNTLPRTDPHVMAFSLLIKRLHREFDPCAGCHDALCAACATAVVDRSGGSEQELMERYWQCHDEISRSLAALQQRVEEARRRRTAAA